MKARVAVAIAMMAAFAFVAFWASGQGEARRNPTAARQRPSTNAGIARPGSVPRLRALDAGAGAATALLREVIAVGPGEATEGEQRQALAAFVTAAEMDRLARQELERGLEVLDERLVEAADTAIAAGADEGRAFFLASIGEAAAEVDGILLGLGPRAAAALATSGFRPGTQVSLWTRQRLTVAARFLGMAPPGP